MIMYDSSYNYRNYVLTLSYDNPKKMTVSYFVNLMCPWSVCWVRIGRLIGSGLSVRLVGRGEVGL